MIEPKPANPYDARISGTRTLSCPDGRSIFKVYFLDIVGRQNPERTEWDRCPMSREGFLAALTKIASGGPASPKKEASQPSPAGTGAPSDAPPAAVSAEQPGRFPFGGAPDDGGVGSAGVGGGEFERVGTEVFAAAQPDGEGAPGELTVLPEAALSGNSLVTSNSELRRFAPRPVPETSPIAERSIRATSFSSRSFAC